MKRLLSKGMSNIYLKATIEKKNCHQVSFGKLQNTQISLSFKASFCNLKIKRLGAKLCVTFLFL